MLKELYAHLNDNRGDENISKMIWVAIVFIIGAVLLLLVTTAFKGPVSSWYDNTIGDWFSDNDGVYDYQTADSSNTNGGGTGGQGSTSGPGANTGGGTSGGGTSGGGSN